MASPVVVQQYDYVYDPRRTIPRGHRSSQAGPDDDALAKAFIDMAKRLDRDSHREAVRP
jgi:hypothetical protein